MISCKNWFIALNFKYNPLGHEIKLTRFHISVLDETHKKLPYVSSDLNSVSAILRDNQRTQRHTRMKLKQTLMAVIFHSLHLSLFRTVPTLVNHSLVFPNQSLQHFLKQAKNLFQGLFLKQPCACF